MALPIIAISMGDPAGVGPELVVKALERRAVKPVCRPLVVADPAVMAGAAGLLGSGLRFRTIPEASQARFEPTEMDVICPPGLVVGPVTFARVDAAMGEAAARCLRHAFELAIAGQVEGVVAAPMNKQAFHLAGYHYLDELAYLADFTHCRDTYTMGVMGSLWTVPVTQHVAFEDVPALITKERVLLHIVRLHRVLLAVMGREPALAVAALNPHGGEGGLFGRQEIDAIAPAVQAAREQGVDARGPFPADTIFVRALAGEFHGVVCMYHDQANIARKLHGMLTGATLYMGLPVPAATTSHGTAFDKAGKGIADPSSLEAALRYVALLAGAERST